LQVEHFLEDAARSRPDKIALVCAGRRLTYRDIDTAANRLARTLTASGVERGDRVAIHLENSVEAVVAVFAALKAGGVFVVINATTKADKLTFILNNCRATALIADGRHRTQLADVVDRTPHTRALVVTGGGVFDTRATRVVSFEQAIDETTDGSRPGNFGIDIDLAALIYTSGTTGTPKGVMLTHLNIVAAATSITSYLENTADEVILNVLPMSFDYGLYQVLMAFKIGGTIVLERSFTYPGAVLDLVVAERVTGLPIVPTISAVLLQMDLRSYDLSHLRYITNTAAALPTKHITELRRRIPHARIYSMYGLTECKRVSYLPPEQIDRRPTSVGKGMPNEEVYIVDEAGNRLRSGVGELVIRGSHVMQGYWELPQETSERLKAGPTPGERVLYSGDLFRMDAEGYLYFLGRKDDIIKTRGEKVSPREVENVLYDLAGVADAAVVGVPDEILGQAIKAVVTVQAGATLTARDVLRHCSERLETFMVPKTVEFRESMPKTTSGKIDKKHLHAAPADRSRRAG
jgi:long-chain acyl-CoA synthetase